MDAQELPKIIAVVGPTASGKTGLGERLALKFGGEIVSADAKQVFRRMDLGTAKEKDLAVPQHLIDIREPGEVITVGQYQRLAYAAIDGLLGAGKLPVLVGGSGLYAEAVLEGYAFGGPGTKRKEPRYRSLKLAIAWDREVLKERAVGRLRERVAAGLPQEVEGLINEGVPLEWLDACGIEYRYFSKYVMGELSLEAAIEAAAIATRQFIKRQYTWWRRHDDLHWVANSESAEALVAEFIKS